MSNRGGLEVALHGFSHQRRTNGGELGGLPADQQQELLSQATYFLDSLLGQRPHTFIPPWNSYDDNTLTFLDSLGYQVISSSLCINQSWENAHIQYLPHTVVCEINGEHVNAFDCFEQTFSKLHNEDGVIVFMFHAYDITEDWPLERIDMLLDSISQMDDVHCYTFSEYASLHPVFDKKLMEANMEQNLLSKHLKMKGMIVPLRYAIGVRIVNVLLYIIVTLLLYFFCLKFRCTKSAVCVAMILTAVVFPMVWFRWLTPMKSLLAAMVLAAICAAFVWAITKKRQA
ncbi:MAG: DUF2334 domain-containing protein [Bacteroidales bacterium]|nr:DUF2334 domain-containing protein [Bacteroidales bacterium]